MEYDKLEYLKRAHEYDKKLLDMITVFSVVYFVFLFIEFYLERLSGTLHVLIIIDTVMCMIFLADALYFLGRAQNKREYFRKYFLDFLAAIPLLALAWLWPQLLFLSLFKIMRGVKSLLKIYDFLIENTNPKIKIKLRKLLP
jgi:voltage-gated potassium channel